MHTDVVHAALPLAALLRHRGGVVVDHEPPATLLHKDALPYVGPAAGLAGLVFPLRLLNAAHPRGGAINLDSGLIHRDFQFGKGVEGPLQALLHCRPATLSRLAAWANVLYVGIARPYLLHPANVAR